MTFNTQILINEDLKVDFKSYFEKEYKASEYLRGEILEKVKDSRSFYKTKKAVFAISNNTFDYKKFTDYKINVESKPDWHPEDITELVEYEIKLGDKLYILFKKYVELEIALSIFKIEIFIQDQENKISSNNIPNNINSENTNNSIIKLKENITKLKDDSCIEQYLSEIISQIVVNKIYIEEDKEILEESKEITKEESKE